MISDDLQDVDLYTLYTPGENVREGIDMTDEEVKTHRLAINASMASLNMSPAERAEMLHILGLAHDDEFRPEFKPAPPTRWCTKKLHNIGDPANFRVRKSSNIFSDDRVCLACEKASKAKHAERYKKED